MGLFSPDDYFENMNVPQARSDGHSDSDIADALGTKVGFDTAAARKGGYSDQEILEHLEPSLRFQRHVGRYPQNRAELDNYKSNPENWADIEKQQPVKSVGELGERVGELGLGAARTAGDLVPAFVGGAGAAASYAGGALNAGLEFAATPQDTAGAAKRASADLQAARERAHATAQGAQDLWNYGVDSVLGEHGKQGEAAFGQATTEAIKGMSGYEAVEPYLSDAAKQTIGETAQDIGTVAQVVPGYAGVRAGVKAGARATGRAVRAITAPTVIPEGTKFDTSGTAVTPGAEPQVSPASPANAVTGEQLRATPNPMPPPTEAPAAAPAAPAALEAQRGSVPVMRPEGEDIKIPPVPPEQRQKERTFLPPNEDGPQPTATPEQAGVRAQHLRDVNQLSGGRLIEHRKSAINGDYDDTGHDFWAAKGDSPAAQHVRERLNNEHDTLHSALDRVHDSLGSTGENGVDTETLEHRGGIVQTALSNINDWFKRTTDNIYTEARRLNGGTPMPREALAQRLEGQSQSFHEFLNDDANFTHPVEQGLQAGVKKQMERLWTTGDPGRNVPPGSIGAAERLREYINEKYHRDNGRVSGQLKQLLDDHVAAHGGPGLFKAARNARAHQASMMEKGWADGGVSKIVSRDDPMPVGKVMNHITDTMSREQVDHLMKVLHASAHLGDGSLAEGAAAAIREIQAHAVAKLTKGARMEGGKFNARGFYDAANRIATKLPSIFRNRPETIGHLRTINRGANVLKMDSNYPGAGASIKRLGGVGELARNRIGDVVEDTLMGAVGAKTAGLSALLGGNALIRKTVAKVLPGGGADAAALREAKGRFQPVGQRGFARSQRGSAQVMREAGEELKVPPVVTHEKDGDDHTFRTKNGYTHGTMTPEGNLQLFGSKTNPGVQGRGEGTARLKAAADFAHSQGGELHSDNVSLSPEQIKAYERLHGMGYDVRLNPDHITHPMTGNLMHARGADTSEPLVRVLPKRGSEADLQRAAGESRNVGTPAELPPRGEPGTAQAPRETGPINSPSMRRQAGAARVMPETSDEGETGHMLNIGLKVGKTNEDISPVSVMQALHDHGVQVEDHTIHQSETEPTFVARTTKKLTKAQGDKLSKALGQEAIAERNPDGSGQLHGPKAGEWGPYNPDYFMMHDGRTASEHAADTSFNPEELEKESQKANVHPKSTVRDAQRSAYPGIYDEPKQIMSRVKTAPEDPILKQLFGVTRKDLHDIALGRGDVAPKSIPGVKEGGKARGSAAGKKVTTDENAERLRNTIQAFKDHDESAYHGMVGWYVMDPLFKKVESIVGKKAAPAAYSRLNTMMGMASPGSDVVTEMNRGTAAHMLALKGEFGKFDKYGGNPGSRGAMKNAPELANVRGHPYHSTSQAVPMRRYLDTGVGARAPKTSMYIGASEVPKSPGFQNKVLVGDSHFSRGVGLSDVRTSADPHGSISGPELADIHPWYHENVAKPSGLPSTSAQAVQWGALSAETGVETAVGAPKLELFAQEVAKAAKRHGVTPEKALEMIIKGQAHAG